MIIPDALVMLNMPQKANKIRVTLSIIFKMRVWEFMCVHIFFQDRDGFAINLRLFILA